MASRIKPFPLDVRAGRDAKGALDPIAKTAVLGAAR